MSGKLQDCASSERPRHREQHGRRIEEQTEGRSLRCCSKRVERRSHRESKVEKLYKCLEQLRGTMPAGLDAQKKYITELKSARLKTFLAMTMTAYGETTGDMKTGDQLAVMKVIDNSTRNCVNKKSKDVTAWEAATAPARFSMYNKGIYGKNKDTFLKDKEKDTPRMKRSIEAFAKIQCAKLSPRKSGTKPCITRLITSAPLGRRRKMKSNRRM